jgi:hypothetical protein
VIPELPASETKIDKNRKEVYVMETLREGSFITFQVGERMPTAYVGSAGPGCFLELWSDLTPNLIINCPHMSEDESVRFAQGIRSYSYLELGTDVPVALWTFSFGSGKGLLCETNFDARALVERGMGQVLLQYLVTPSNLLNVFVTDNWIITHLRAAGLSHDAVDRFKGTLKRQLNKKYSHADFDKALIQVEQCYSGEDLASYGRSYRMRGQEAPQRKGGGGSMKHRSFPLGRVVATPGVRAAVPEQRMRDCLLRHARGDWGILPLEDVAENEKALSAGYRVMSAYPIDPARPSKGYGSNTLWIITEADRSITTVLLPGEY